LRRLDWQSASCPELQNPIVEIKGHPYVAHAQSGDCVFLDPVSKLCNIHKRFGFGAKPLGCRIYPMNIVSTFPGECSVTARLDCPAVQQHTGPSLEQLRKEILGYVNELDPGLCFDKDDLAQLEPATIRFLTEQLTTNMLCRTDLFPGTKSLELALNVERLEGLGTMFLNDHETLETVMPSFLARTEANIAENNTWRPVGGFVKAAYRLWLEAYLRRDEETLRQGFSARLKRTRSLIQILYGRGSFGALGEEHPNSALSDVPLFPGHCRSSPALPSSSTVSAAQNEVWSCYWRYVEARMRALQFFGPAYFGVSFFRGLRALVMTFPLVLGAARCRARSEDRSLSDLTAEDIQYATGAVDHSFGRSALLGMTLYRSLETFFSSARYGRLLATMNWN